MCNSRASCRADHPSSSISRRYALAVSIGWRSWRSRFSTSWSWRIVLSVIAPSWMTQGTARSPACRAARNRRSPATMAYLPRSAFHRTRIGCKTPRAVMLWTRSSISASEKTTRGCLSSRTIWVTAISTRFFARVRPSRWAGGPARHPRRRSQPCCCRRSSLASRPCSSGRLPLGIARCSGQALQQLVGQRSHGFGGGPLGLVFRDRLPVGDRLRKVDRVGDHGREDGRAVDRAKRLLVLPVQCLARVIHRDQETDRRQGWVIGGARQVDRLLDIQQALG